jgi:hypothetical protein
LEKSRIVTHSHDERNYHVFYELLEGFDAEEKRKYGLTTPEKYFYLNQVNIHSFFNIYRCLSSSPRVHQWLLQVNQIHMIFNRY